AALRADPPRRARCAPVPRVCAAGCGRPRSSPTARVPRRSKPHIPVVPWLHPPNHGPISHILVTVNLLNDSEHYHEVGYAVFLQLGVIFAVLLAFVFNGVWSDYNTASRAIDSECA